MGIGWKIGSTAIIWGFATGMFAICIPLVSATESGIVLPLSIIIAVTISTVAVWVSSTPQQLPKEKEEIEVNNREK